MPPSQASKADASALTAYALQSAVDTSSEVDSKIATALLDAVTTAALDAALLGKADASALASLLSTVDGLDTPLKIDTKIANALLGLATKAFVAAQLASRDASITALQGAKADATLLASYATNAALSASETTLQSALDAILAELAALQLSGSGGVVNAPAWAGFTTWELVRGSNVVRNLLFMAPLSAALANGDDTLSITADCYSTAGTDAAITAALLAYYTSAQVDALLGDYRTGAAQDAETTSAITAALLAYYTSAQVDALLGDYRTASAQDTQTQAAIAGALLAYRTGPDQDPLYGSFVGDQGAWSTAKMYFTVPPNGVAKLHFGAHFQAPGLPNQTVDVYGLQILDATLETGSAVEAEEDTAASALLLKHEFLDGGADDVTLATLGEVLLEPTLTTLGNFLVRSNPERLRLEHRAHLHADAGETLLLRLPVQAGHGLQLGDVRQRGRQRLRGRHRHLPRHALAGRLEHGAPGLLGAAGRNREAALRSLRRLYPRAGAAVGGHAGPVQHADQGQRL